VKDLGRCGGELTRGKLLAVPFAFLGGEVLWGGMVEWRHDVLAKILGLS
jgi:hypothetical protein